MFLVFLAVPVLTLMVVVALDVPSPSGAGAGPTGVSAVDRWLKRLRPWHAAASGILSVLFLLSFLDGGEPVPFVLAVALVLALFARAWRHEFTLLMALPDDAFPGRN